MNGPGDGGSTSSGEDPPAEESASAPTAVGVVTAAGKSTRMGGFPKPLLRFGDDRFVERIVRRLREAGVRETVVVLGYEAEIVRERAALPDATVLVNDDYESGMLSSVQLGVERARELNADALFLWPVDYPCAPASAATALHERYRETDANVVVPTHGGERGHPALFGAETFADLLTAPAEEGARAVVYDEATTVREVAVEDPRVLVDVDTPEEYWDAVRRFE